MSSELPRHHYAALDGLRGILAVGVLLYHMGHWFALPDFFPKFGLAVDTFFFLSGFVLPFAYMERKNSISDSGFIIRRLIRLLPIIILAILISAIYVIFRNYMKPEASIMKPLSFAIVLALLNLPYFNAPLNLGGPQVFPLNGPQYTLSLEIMINIIWWRLRFLNQRIISLIFIFTSLFFVIFIPLSGDVTDTWITGLPRVAFSFFFGSFIYSFRNYIRINFSTPKVYFIILLCIFFVLSFPFELGRWLDIAWILVISPLLVLFSYHVRLSGKVSYIALFAGELSYPLYALHYPLFCFINGACQIILHKQTPYFEIPILFIFIPTLSFFILKFYDEPFRKYLMSVIFSSRGGGYIQNSSEKRS